MWGAVGVGGCRGRVYSASSLRSKALTASVTILDGARGKVGVGLRGRGRRGKGQGRGQKGEQEEEVGRREGPTGVMSCLWPERREEPRDMTDYRRGQSSRPMPRPRRSVMGAGRGVVGHREGRKQERHVLVKESGRKKGEEREKEKKKPFERILCRNVLICVAVGGPFRCYYKTCCRARERARTRAQTHSHTHRKQKRKFCEVRGRKKLSLKI